MDADLRDFMKTTFLSMYNSTGAKMDKETMWNIVMAKFKHANRKQFEFIWTFYINEKL